MVLIMVLMVVTVNVGDSVDVNDGVSVSVCVSEVNVSDGARYWKKLTLRFFFLTLRYMLR